MFESDDTTTENDLTISPHSTITPKMTTLFICALFSVTVPCVFTLLNPLDTGLHWTFFMPCAFVHPTGSLWSYTG